MKNVRSSAEIMPWLVPVTDGLVTCKDSSFLASFEFAGVDADSAGETEMFQVGQAAERMMGLLRDLPVTIWWTVRRERTFDYPGEPMPDPVSAMLDDEHRAQFLSGSAYVNRHYFSLIWMPERSTAGMFAKAGALMADGASATKALMTALASRFSGRTAFAWKAAEIEMAINDLEMRLEQIEGVMSTVGFRRLRGQDFLGFLWAQANPGTRAVPKAWNGEHFLDVALPERAITVHGDSLQFGDGSDAAHASLLSMKAWPAALAFGAFDNLTSLPTEMVISHCFRVMSTHDTDKHIDAVKRLNDLLKYPLSSFLIGLVGRKGEMNESKANPARAEASEQAMLARGEMTAGRLLFGYHNLSIMILDEDFGRMEHTTRELVRTFNSGQFTGVVRESMHALSAFATTLPGQWQECRRWMTLSSENQVHIAPLMGVAMGERYNAHLTQQLGKTAQALTVLSTDLNTPYYFNFHAGALGHTFVVGPSRSGKSIGMNFLISQFRKYGDAARVIIFDKDFSCRIPTLLQGGDHIDLRPGSPVKLNPLSLLADPSAVPFLASWIESLMGSRGYAVTADDVKRINEALRDMRMGDPELWTLETVGVQVGNLSVHLDEWIRPGARAYFDNAEDTFDVSDFTTIEMGEIMKDPRVARAFMDYAFFRIQRMLEAQRDKGVKATLVYVEEAWFLLADPHFAARLKDWLKTFAKLNAFVVLCTQSMEDMLEVPASVFASIRDNVQTYVFLPNPRAITESAAAVYRKQFGLRDDLIERIATSVPKQDYVIVKPDVARKVHLQLTKRQVAALRSDIAAQRVFERHYQARTPGWQAAYINEVMGV